MMEDFTAVPSDSVLSGFERKALHAVDIVIFVVVLVISLGIGLYYALHGERQNTTSEYLMGKRKLRLFPVTASMLMSYISAILILGNTAEMYKYGIQASLSGLGSCLAALLSARLFVPLFYRLKLVSSFDYLERRYKSRYVMQVGTVMSILSSVSYMGVAMFAPSTALEAVTTVPAWLSIVICGVVVTCYTTVGGMKAVVWTDAFQGLVYMSGIILILVMGTSKVGGIAEVFTIAKDNGRLNMFPISTWIPDPTIRLTMWNVVVGRLFTSLYFAMRQETVQRYSALQSEVRAMASVVMFIPSVFFAYVLTCLIGFVVFAYFTKIGCDPLRAGFIKNSNQLLPYFVVNVLDYPGIAGLFLAVLYSGALSSVSSSLNSLSAVTWKTFLESKFSDVTEFRKALITKIIVFIYGVVGVIIAFISQSLSGHVMMLTQSFLGSIGGPLYAMFIIGAFFPCANAIGAVTGAITGLVFGNWIAIGSNIADYHRAYLPTIVSNCTLPANVTAAPMPTQPSGVFPLYKISFFIHGMLGTIVALIVGLVVSYLTGTKKTREKDSSLLVPVVDRCCCCFSQACRHVFYCGVQYETHQPAEMEKVPNVEKLQNHEEDGLEQLSMEPMLLTVDKNFEKSSNAATAKKPEASEINWSTRLLLIARSKAKSPKKK